MVLSIWQARTREAKMRKRKFFRCPALKSEINDAIKVYTELWYR